ncbi:uncharacterized protein LOC144707384 isoform X2 [Wolffia australiana]
MRTNDRHASNVVPLIIGWGNKMIFRIYIFKFESIKFFGNNCVFSWFCDYGHDLLLLVDRITQSRKSTRTRQKQYFEQRKRQKLSLGKEYHEDKQHKHLHDQEKMTSLDILSLNNLAEETNEYSPHDKNMTNASEGKMKASQSFSTVSSKKASPYLWDSSNDSLPHFSLEDGVITCEMCTRSERSPGLNLEKRVKPCHDTLMKQNNSSSSGDETRDPKSSVDAVTSSPRKAEDHFDYCKKLDMGRRLDIPKMRSSSKKDVNLENRKSISILDLVGEDQLHSESEDRASEEHHVAFSVKGLGKISMKTPVHSPRQLESYRSPTSSSVWVGSLQSDLRKNLGTMDEGSFLNSDDPWELTSQKWDEKVPLFNSSRSPHRRKKGNILRGGLNSFLHPFRSSKESFFSDSCNGEWQLGDIDTLGESHIDDMDYGTCEDRPIFQDFNIYRSCKAKPTSSDNSGFMFSQGARSAKCNLKNFGIPDLDGDWLPPEGPVSSLWHQSIEEDEDSICFHSPRYQRDVDCRSSPKRNSGPVQSLSAADVVTDNTSLLSEESCSTAPGYKKTSNLNHERVFGKRPEI